MAELLKARYRRALDDNLYFWRDRAGHEIDLLVDLGLELLPVEVKSGKTVAGSFLEGLRKWRDLAGDAAGRGWLVYGGGVRQSRTDVEILPWAEIGALAEAVG